jgi:hypothetical protein
MSKQPRKSHSKRFARRGPKKKPPKKEKEKKEERVRSAPLMRAAEERTSCNRLEKSQIGDGTAADATTKNTDANAVYKRTHESRRKEGRSIRQDDVCIFIGTFY